MFHSSSSKPLSRDHQRIVVTNDISIEAILFALDDHIKVKKNRTKRVHIIKKHIEHCNLPLKTEKRIEKQSNIFDSILNNK